jgi:MoxR-like ATPase
MIELITQTREGPEFLLGGGPRATLALYRGSQALAAINGRGFVLPDDAKSLFPAVLGHRVMLSAESRIQRLTVDQALAAAADRVDAPIVTATDAGA